jgi:hypothetical protein
MIKYSLKTIIKQDTRYRFAQTSTRGGIALNTIAPFTGPWFAPLTATGRILGIAGDVIESGIDYNDNNPYILRNTFIRFGSTILGNISGNLIYKIPNKGIKTGSLIGTEAGLESIEGILTK